MHIESPSALHLAPGPGGDPARWPSDDRVEHVQAVDPADDAALHAWYELLRVAQHVDLPGDPDPCPIRVREQLRHPWPDQASRLWLVLDGARAVAGCLVLLPTADNRDMAEIELVVHPEFRRRGTGRRLLAQVADQVRAEGRSRIISGVYAPLDAVDAWTAAGSGPSFARAAGARPVTVEMERLLEVGSIDEAAYDRLLADALAHSPGYSTVRWNGPVPEEYAADLAELTGRMSTDTPLDDLAMEPERYDTGRIRAEEKGLRVRGVRHYTTGAVHDATGRLVGFTELRLAFSHSDHASQEITIVGPGHRGHRLGMRMKIENLRWTRAHEPALRTVDTWNADANGPMIAVNEAMGFRPHRRAHIWELTLS